MKAQELHQAGDSLSASVCDPYQAFISFRQFSQHVKHTYTVHVKIHRQYIQHERITSELREEVKWVYETRWLTA